MVKPKDSVCVFVRPSMCDLFFFFSSSPRLHHSSWRLCSFNTFFLFRATCMYMRVSCFFPPGKIEVKILTRKNAEEAGDQWLTEEDSKSFRELLINLLVNTPFDFAALNPCQCELSWRLNIPPDHNTNTSWCSQIIHNSSLLVWHHNII